MRRGWTAFVGLQAWVWISACANGQPDLLWIDQFGTGSFEKVEALTPDGAGGVFFAGYTIGDLGGASAGGRDVFLARCDFAGNVAWLTQFGTSGHDTATALAPDDSGGVFVGGYTEGDFGGLNAGEYDLFVARCDSAGGRIWIKQLGSGDDDEAYALAPDGAGGVYVAGYTDGDLGGPNSGGYDAFISHYDGEGNQSWTHQFGTSLPDYAHALAIDGEGGVFVAGATGGNLGGGHIGSSDGFLARYDIAGERAWIKQFGTSDYDGAFALAPDGTEGVFIGGFTWGDLGGPNNGWTDAFVARYTSAGAQTWVELLGTTSYDQAYALAPDGSGGVFVGGYTEGDFGGPNTGKRDVFLVRCAANGEQTLLKQFGSIADEGVHALASDSSGGVYVAGYTKGDLGGPNAGYEDAFLAHFGTQGCYPDFTGDGALDLFDFLAYLNEFNAGGNGAECDQDQGLTLFDFLCYVNAFNAGC